MSENEVRALEQGRKETAVSFEVGDRVAIRQGVLEGFEGVIAEIDNDKKMAVVNVNNMFGEVTPTNVEIAAIKKI